MTEANEHQATGNTLNYSELIGQHGISIDRSQGGLRIFLPPVYSLGRLPKGYWISTAVLAAVLAILFRQAQLAGVGLTHMLPAILEIALVFLIIWMVAWNRLRQRSVFTLGNGRFSVQRASGRGIGRHASWPNQTVEEIRFSPISQKMIIRIREQDTQELFVSADPRVTQIVAETLNTALRDGSADQPLDTREGDDAAAKHAASTRRRLLMVSGALAAATLIFVLAYPPLLAFWVYLMIPIAIPAGIALGEQPKKFWA